MAFRRSGIIAGTKSYYRMQQPRFSPSFSHNSSGSEGEEIAAKTISRNSEYPSPFMRYNAANSLLSGNVSRLMRSDVRAGYGLIIHRNLCNDVEVVYDVAPVLGDKAVEAAAVVNEVAVAAVVNEVAVAAADSFAPVAAFQYLIDYVHYYTGFEWWASIAAITLAIRFLELPFLIYQLQFFSKYYQTLKRPHLFAAKQAIENEEDPDTQELLDIVSKYDAGRILGLCIADVNACLLFLAILNMAEKVPSFITGGTMWFTDLTTTGGIRLPILFALTLWLRLELNPKRRVVGDRPPKNLNKFAAASALLGAVTVGFPSAIYCYWITSNLFSVAFAIVMRDPQVQKVLGICMKPPSSDKKS